MSTELRLVVKMIQTTELVKNVRECLSKAKKKKTRERNIPTMISLVPTEYSILPKRINHDMCKIYRGLSNSLRKMFHNPWVLYMHINLQFTMVKQY